MRVLVCLLCWVLCWNSSLVWAGAAEVRYNEVQSLEVSKKVPNQKLKKSVLKPKSPKGIKRKATSYGAMRAIIAISIILSVAALVGFGIGLALGTAWLWWLGIGYFAALILFGFFNMLIQDDWEDLTILLIALLLESIFGLAALVLGLVYSVVWAWVLGLSILLIFGVILWVLFNAFK